MTDTITSAPTGRVKRKREQARQSILQAAETLMRDNGVDAITIQDITERADVGHGTFYTHFSTKMEVLVPIAESHAQELTRRIDALTADIEDTAEVVSISVRHLLRAIARDPLWTWFLSNAQLPMDAFRRGIGDSGRRDFRRGMHTGRFTALSQDVLEPFLVGALIGIIRERADNLVQSDAAEECARVVLQMMGLAPDEAAEIAFRPLPDLPQLDAINPV